MTLCTIIERRGHEVEEVAINEDNYWSDNVRALGSRQLNGATLAYIEH